MTVTKNGMKTSESDTLYKLQFSNLQANSRLSHFVTTKLNADSINAILNIPKVYVSRQIHGNSIAAVNEQTGTLDGFDALITCAPNVCIAVATADCVPVLLFAPDKKVIAAVHAGWRGTALKILQKTVRQMVEQFGCCPQLMQAGIAPAISMEAFEVGEEVVESFRKAGENMDDPNICNRNPLSGKMHVDLKNINRMQLIAAGLHDENIEVSNGCTYRQSEQFLSARRQGTDCGRMLTGIMIKRNTQ